MFEKALECIIGCGVLAILANTTIKRFFKNKDEQKKMYFQLRNKLCEYKNYLNDVIISYYNHSNHELYKLNQKTANIKNNIKRINEKLNTCDIDKNNIDIINEIKKEKESLETEYNSLMQDYKNLNLSETDKWYDTILSTIKKYKNLINNLGLMKYKSNLLIHYIGVIDKYTLELELLTPKNENNSNAIITHCSNIIKEIDYAIIELDKLYLRK